MRDVDVLVYGASGYTGRLIAAELAHEGASFALAGRDGKRLEDVARGLGVDVPVHVAALDDVDALDAALRRAKVVVHAAGPFVDLGPPVVEAAIRAGTHYLDITGEQAFLRWAFEQDASARDAGVTMVPAMGVDVLPGDIAALVATTAMRTVERLDVAIWSNARPSGGTLRSMARHSAMGWWYDRGRFRKAPLGRWRRSFAFPEPIGTKEAVFGPWGDVVTAPRSTGAKRVRTFFARRPRLVRMLHATWPLNALLVKTGLPARAIRRRAPRTGEGSDAARRAREAFAYFAEAVDDEGVTQYGYTYAKDPYGFTAAAAVRGAQVLAGASAARGVLTPTQAFAFGPFTEPLRERFGFVWKARSLSVGLDE